MYVHREKANYLVSASATSVSFFSDFIWRVTGYAFLSIDCFYNSSTRERNTYGTGQTSTQNTKVYADDDEVDCNRVGENASLKSKKKERERQQRRTTYLYTHTHIFIIQAWARAAQLK